MSFRTVFRDGLAFCHAFRALVRVKFCDHTVLRQQLIGMRQFMQQATYDDFRSKRM